MQIPATKILLIEDDEEDKILLQKYLSRITHTQYELTWEATSAQGIYQLLSGQYDLCFLDYRLDGRNGIELVAEARQQGCTLPIVVLTGASSPELDIQALQVGADDYIDKAHLQGELLHRVIRYAIERRRAEQERTRFQYEQTRASFRESLAFEQSRFEQVLRHLPSGALIAEAPGGKIVLGNPQAEAMLRHPIFYSPDIQAYTAWVGWHLDGRLVQPEEWPLARAVRGEYAAGDFKYQRGDGTICFIHVNGVPIKDLSGRVVAGMVTIDDITKRKELEHQQETLLSMATHELKTPLTSLQGNIQLAQRRLRRLTSSLDPLVPTSQKEVEEALLLLARAEQQLRIQTRLINELLEMSRMQAESFELSPLNCDLLSLVGEVVQDFQISYPQRAITLHLPEQNVLLVYADPDRLRQVLSNYISNALKYSPAETPIDVGLALDAQDVRVWVRDQGPGLSPESQEHVWRRFYRDPETREHNKAGISLGLGLSICQQLVNKHQGQVGVESQLGQGSTFWFAIPAASQQMYSVEDAAD